VAACLLHTAGMCPGRQHPGHGSIREPTGLQTGALHAHLHAGPLGQACELQHWVRAISVLGMPGLQHLIVPWSATGAGEGGC
jgi:hypothetical protein